jgi:hypothetical protein
MTNAIGMFRIATPVTVGVFAMLLGGCSASADEEDYSIRGTVAGLSASGLVLQYNGTGSISVTAGATSVTITDVAVPGSSYAVTVLTQPTGLLCSVANGSGTATTDVENVAITCSVPYTISGTITGYTGSGLALRLNGQGAAAYNVTPPTGATTFTFSAGLATGASYTVGVATQPTQAQSCSVTSGGSGTVASANVSNVTVSCVSNAPYTVGGTVSGLTGSGLSLRMRYTGATTHPVVNVQPGENSFAFPDMIPANGIFDIGILAQPAGQSCVLTRGRGASPQNVTNVGVSCVNNNPSTLVGTYTLLTANGRAYLSFNADGTFTTAAALYDSGCNTASDTGNGNGVEYGTFAWNSSTGALTLPAPAAIDTSGDCVFANGGVATANMTVQKGTGTITYQDSGGNPSTLTAIAAPNPTASVVGAYVPEAGNGLLLVLHADNTFLFAETQGGPGRFSSQERGCYAVTATEISFTVDANCRPDNLNAYDFNGPYGLGPFPATPSIGPQPFVIESATVLVLNGSRWKRSLPN